MLSHSLARTIQLHIYMAQFPLSPFPLAGSPLFPFVSPSTYLAPSSCDRNRPPPSQVACKLTPFVPPFTQLSHPPQIPRTPIAPRLTMTTSGIFRLLLSGTLLKVRTLGPSLYSISIASVDVPSMETERRPISSID
jgi:hypothetical protein